MGLAVEGRVRVGGRSRGLASDVVDKFRARLLLHKLERVALERTLELAEELGMLDGPVEQIIDSTPMLGAAATQDTVRLVRQGVRKLLDASPRVDEDAAAGSMDGLEFDYARPGEKPDCRWRERAERERMLTRVAEDAGARCRPSNRRRGCLVRRLSTGAHRLLRELIGQDFDIDDDGVPRLHRGTRADRIVSTVDTEMRHGRKSQHQRFDGYKLSAAATNTGRAADHGGRCRGGGRDRRPAGQAPHRLQPERPPTEAGAG